MWHYLIEQLAAEGNAGDPVFWSDMEREAERSMLHQLFAVATREGVVSADEIVHFLHDLFAMHPSGAYDGRTRSPHRPSFDLDAATRRLLYIDERLSPISQALFARRLLSDQDREALKLALGPSGDLLAAGHVHVPMTM